MGIADSDWRSFLTPLSSEYLDLLRCHERTGRPLGAGGFVEEIERAIGRILQPQKPRPKNRGQLH
jgi:putative transposase